MFDSSRDDDGAGGVAPALPSCSRSLAAVLAAVRDLAADPGALHGAAGGVRGAADGAAEAAGGSGVGRVVEDLAVVQQIRNVLDAVEQGLIARVARERLHEPFGFPSVAAMLVARLRISRTDANARQARAGLCTARDTLTGQLLPAVLPVLAAAQTRGQVTGESATVIVRGLTALRAAGTASPEALGDVERALTELAGRAEPAVVARAVRHAAAVFDPDGAEPRDRYQQARRTLQLRQRCDGMGELRAVLTPEALATLQTVLSPLAAPNPADPSRDCHPATGAAAGTDGLSGADSAGRDPRTVGQRQHDALLELCQRLLRSGTLPDHGGVPLTLTVTIDADQLTTRTGTAVTGHGTTLDVATLLATAAELQIIPVVLNRTGGILAYGTTRRLATPAQTTALRARDRGCSFPGCPRPAEWCQRHHVVDAARGGPTDLDNLTLLCGWHHRTFTRHGWECHMIDGRPWWTPPASIDPHRRPRRNTHHDPPDFNLAG